MSNYVREILLLLAEARDCVAESKDAAEAAPSPRPARIEYFTDLLAGIDKALKETSYD